MTPIQEIPLLVTEEVFNKHNSAAVDDYYAAGFVWHGPGDTEITRDDFRQIIDDFLTAFPDVQLEVQKQIAAGDVVATRWRAEGTHLGDYLGVAPSGNRMIATGIAMDRIEDGLIVEGWEDIDLYGALVCIGGIDPSSHA